MNYWNNKKFTSMFILLIWLFIFVFFTMDIYSSMTDKIETNKKLKAEYKSKVDLKSDLSKNAKKLKLNQDNSEVNSEIKKYIQEYSEDRIIRLFYNFSNTYDTNWQIVIKSLNLGKPKQNEIGMKDAKIQISARVSNKRVMLDFLDFIINNSEYKFFIHSFTVPKKTDTPFNIQVPIEFFYQDFKEIEK